MFHPQGPTLFELAVQAMSSVERGYDLLAPRFDHTPFRTPDAVVAAALRAVGPCGSVTDALDLCCGTGVGIRHLQPLCTGRVTGVDLSQGMLDRARALLAEHPHPTPVDLVRGDALDLAFRDCFDLVVSFGALGHIARADEPRLVRSVFRALRPGGRCVFVTTDPPPPWSPRAVQARAFNAVMAVRNALWRPPFVMYYLTFLVPRARALLEAQGFTVTVHRGLVPPPYDRCVLVVAQRPVQV